MEGASAEESYSAAPFRRSKIMSSISYLFQRQVRSPAICSASCYFSCCGRAGEVTMPDTFSRRNPKKYMRRETSNVTASSFSSRLPYHKADPLYVGSTYFFVSSQAGTNFSLSAFYYTKARDRLFGNTGPLFLKQDGTVPTRSWFVKRLKKYFGKQYTGHSGRPGGATWYILLGWKQEDVKRQGRWKSQAWEDYIRITPEVAMALTQRAAFENGVIIK